MIPSFPDWRPVLLDDRDEIRALGRPCIPNADHSFALLYAWNANERIQVCRHSGHLLLRFGQESGAATYTFAGNDTDVERTAETLLEQAGGAALRLVPVQIARRLNPVRFQVEEDLDCADYLISTQALAEQQGPCYTERRKGCARFEREFKPSAMPLDLGSPAITRSILDLNEKWHARRDCAELANSLNTPWGVGDDCSAIHRIIQNAGVLDVVALGVMVHGQLAAFVLAELLPGPFAIMHFLKSDTEAFPRASDYATREMARLLLRLHGRTVINFEEDGGSISLRRYKTSLRAFAFIHKYTVTSI